MTSRSQKYIIILPKKVQKREGERFHLIIYARRNSHLGKTEKLPHFKILNAISDKMAGRFDLILEVETHFDVI